MGTVARWMSLQTGLALTNLTAFPPIATPTPSSQNLFSFSFCMVSSSFSSKYPKNLCYHEKKCNFAHKK